jgi:hypothetical protein
MAVGFTGLRRSPRFAQLAGIRGGLLIVVVGLLAMALGNVAEYWLFVDQPHGAMNARAFSWIGLLLGALLASLGALVAGMAMLKVRSYPLWLGVVLALLLPVTIVAAALSVSLLFVPLGVAAIAVGAESFLGPRRHPAEATS